VYVKVVWLSMCSIVRRVRAVKGLGVCGGVGMCQKEWHLDVLDVYISVQYSKGGWLGVYVYAAG